MYCLLPKMMKCALKMQWLSINSESFFSWTPPQFAKLISLPWRLSRMAVTWGFSFVALSQFHGKPHSTIKKHIYPLDKSKNNNIVAGFEHMKQIYNSNISILICSDNITNTFGYLLCRSFFFFTTQIIVYFVATFYQQTRKHAHILGVFSGVAYHRVDTVEFAV